MKEREFNPNSGLTPEGESIAQPVSELLRQSADEYSDFVKVADSFRKQWQRRSKRGILSNDRGFLELEEAAMFIMEQGLADDSDVARNVLTLSAIDGEVVDRDPRLLPYKSEGSQISVAIVPHTDKSGLQGYMLRKINFWIGAPG